jgi:hypothetical protein
MGLVGGNEDAVRSRLITNWKEQARTDGTVALEARAIERASAS